MIAAATVSEVDVGVPDETLPNCGGVPWAEAALAPMASTPSAPTNATARRGTLPRPNLRCVACCMYLLPYAILFNTN